MKDSRELHEDHQTSPQGFGEWYSRYIDKQKAGNIGFIIGISMFIGAILSGSILLSFVALFMFALNIVYVFMDVFIRNYTPRMSDPQSVSQIQSESNRSCCDNTRDGGRYYCECGRTVIKHAI